MRPLVSVIIPVYNRAATIQRAVDSVLRQSYKELEIIIVDDCSSDDTVRVVNSYQDKRIKLICLSRNSGANTARNTGIRAAKGEYIAFQDSDDEWLENKLELQMDYMFRTGKKVCYCSHILLTENEKIIIPDDNRPKEIYEEKIAAILRKENVVSTQTLVIHKEVTEKVGMFDEEMKRLQDYEFLIRICQKYEIAYVKESLVNVYRMEACISNDNAALADALLKILVRHIAFVDFESILHWYLFYCEWYDGVRMNLEWIDTVLRTVRGAGKRECVELCVKTREFMTGWYDYFTKHIIGHEFVIYGAGFYGKNAYNMLKRAGAVPKSFWVTYHQQEKDFDGIPIVRIPDSIKRQIPVVVSVSREKQEEMVDNLIVRGITNYYIYPFDSRTVGII